MTRVPKGVGWLLYMNFNKNIIFYKRMLKKIINTILLKCSNRNSRVDYLRKIGVRCGDDVHFYGSSNVFVDENFPWMLTIGNNVHITSGVHILCHDYSWIVGKNYYKEVLGGVGKVSIGNNVFIGTDAIVLMNTEIGDNVIIGAKSVVSGKIPGNCVVAGTPAKPIMSLKEYWERRKTKQYVEAVQAVVEFKRRFGEYPPKEKIPAYFYLFEPRDKASIERNEVFKSRLSLDGDYDACIDNFLKSKPMFDSYESFLSSIMD